MATACIVTLASVAASGIEPWRVWIEWVVNPPAEAYQNYQTWNHLADESVYTNLFLVHAPAAFAKFGDSRGAPGICCVWWSYRRERSDQLQLVALLAATTLAAPHVANYDMVMLSVAATVLFASGLARNAGWIALAGPATGLDHAAVQSAGRLRDRRRDAAADLCADRLRDGPDCLLARPF